MTYYDDITARLRERLGDHAESIIQLAYDATVLDRRVDKYDATFLGTREDGEAGERDSQQEPYVGDLILNAVYALICGLDNESDELTAAYHRLYDTWWNKTATVEIPCPGHNGISYDDDNAMDEAAETIEHLLNTQRRNGQNEP